MGIIWDKEDFLIDLCDENIEDPNSTWDNSKPMDDGRYLVATFFGLDNAKFLQAILAGEIEYPELKEYFDDLAVGDYEKWKNGEITETRSGYIIDESRIEEYTNEEEWKQFLAKLLESGVTFGYCCVHFLISLDGKIEIVNIVRVEIEDDGTYSRYTVPQQFLDALFDAWLTEAGSEKTLVNYLKRGLPENVRREMDAFEDNEAEEEESVDNEAEEEEPVDRGIHIKTLHELFPTEEDKEAFLHCLTTKTFWASKVDNFLDSSHNWLKEHPQAYALVEEDASPQVDVVNDRAKLAESTGLDLFMLNDLYFRSLLVKHTELKNKTDDLIKSLMACTTVEDLDVLGCKTFPGEWATNVKSSPGKTRTLKAEDGKLTYIKGTDSGTGVKMPCFTRPIAYPELFADRTDEELKCHALDLTYYVYNFAVDNLKDKYHDKNLYSDIENYLLNNTLPEDEKRCKILKGVEYYFFVYSVLSCITPTKDCISLAQYTFDSDKRYAQLLHKHREDVVFNLLEHSHIEWNTGTKHRVVFDGDSCSVLNSRYKADDYVEPALSKVVVENVIKPVLHKEHIKSCLFSYEYSWGADPVTICLEAPSKTCVSEDAINYEDFIGRLFVPGYTSEEKGMTRVRANPSVVAALAKLPTGSSKRKSLNMFYRKLTWFNDYLSQGINTEKDESFDELFNEGITEQEVLDGTARFVIFLLDNSVIDLGVFLRENIKPTLLLQHGQLAPESNETGGVDYIIDRSDYHYSSDSAFYFIVDNEEQKAQAEELMRGVIDNTCAFTKGSLELKYEIIVADQDVAKFPEFSSVIQNSFPKSPAISIKTQFSQDCFERDLLKEQVLYYKLILNCIESSDGSYLRSAKHFAENNGSDNGITEVLLDDFANGEERDTAKKRLIEFSNSDSYDSALFVRAECSNGTNPGLIIRRQGLITHQYLPRLCEDGRLRYEKVSEGVYFVPIGNSPYYGSRYNSKRYNTYTYLPVYVKSGVAEWLYPSEIPDFIPVVHDTCNEIDAMSIESLMAYAFEASIVRSGEKEGYFGEVRDDAI